MDTGGLRSVESQRVGRAAAAAAESLQSFQLYRRQSTRLPRPWDSPGKNTGVGAFHLSREKALTSVYNLVLIIFLFFSLSLFPFRKYRQKVIHSQLLLFQIRKLMADLMRQVACAFCPFGVPRGSPQYISTVNMHTRRLPQEVWFLYRLRAV